LQVTQNLEFTKKELEQKASELESLKKAHSELSTTHYLEIQQAKQKYEEHILLLTQVCMDDQLNRVIIDGSQRGT